jgi:hypothetical protein
MPDGFDLIGDIHGHASALRDLLRRMGYVERNGCFRHSCRQAIFLGDFIDRGPEQRDVVAIVRDMVERDAALAVMGNHEFNALAYHAPDPANPEDGLRPNNPKNTAQHQAFLDQFPCAASRAEALEWFWTLPLWLDLEGIRVVHAAWDCRAMKAIEPALTSDRCLTHDLLVKASRKETTEWAAVETLLKGVEVKLPKGITFTDSDGHARTHARIKWWRHAAGETWQSLFLGPPEVARKLPAEPVDDTVSQGYPGSAPPVFIGHYWLNGTPKPVARNVACVDYSVARTGGKLVAYRWDGEGSGECELAANKFFW